jgi:hypothetical protein
MYLEVMNAMNNRTVRVAARAKKWRFNPLTNLKAASLARHLDAFDAGNLREAALIWDALEQRDDLLRGVISKRKKSVARHGWTVLPKADLNPAEEAAAREQVEALQFFYRNLECEHAVDRAERGGFKLLARQMMDAVGKRFAVHELVWKECASADGVAAHGMNRNFVTAKFRFVPLGFFENTTGKLRFLESEGAMEGRDLEPGAWMVTVGEGLMVASSTAWMFKHLSLDDWMNCSNRNGTPALLGISSAAEGSAQWLAMHTALQDLLNGESVVHGTSDKVQVLDMMAGRTMPFPQLVERIDRMLAALWRGADLSTISRDRGYGASLQEKETCALEEDDAEMLTETLNRYVDEWVIRHVFGEGVRPLAGVKVLVSPRECTTGDLQIDEFLIRHGAPLSIRETMTRYGRALPEVGERVFAIGKGGDVKESKLLAAHIHAGNLENQGADCGPVVSFGSQSAAEPGVEKTDTELANQFTLLQEEWVQLSPFGDYPHSRGLQRVDRAAADAMVAQFNSFRGRLGRLFGGVPFYVGHPDLPSSSDLVDRKAYGWIMEVEAREDGFFGRVKWSDAGMELLRNAHFKYLSPFWEAREIASENGRRIYRPVALLSAGLTNQPNIPVRPLANEVGDAERVGRRRARSAELLPVLASCGASGDLKRTQGVVIENDAERSDASSAGASLHPIPARSMHTVSCTENLGTRRGELVRMQNRRDRIQECVLRKVRLGLSYDEAWESVKREHQDWFEQDK